MYEGRLDIPSLTRPEDEPRQTVGRVHCLFCRARWGPRDEMDEEAAQEVMAVAKGATVMLQMQLMVRKDL